MKKVLLSLLLLILLIYPAAAQSHLADTLYNKSRKFWYNNWDSAKHYLQLALKVSRESKYLKGEANALKGLGFISHSNAEKLQCYVKALEIRRQLNDSMGMGISLSDIGTVYRALGEKNKMLDYCQRSLQIRRKIKDYGGIALCLIQFGNIEEENSNFSKALDFYKEALYYRLKAGDPNGIAYAHINIASLFLKLKKYDSAISLGTLAEQEFIKVGNKYVIEWTTWVQGKCYLEMGLPDRALSTLQKNALAGNKWSLRNTLLLAEIYERKSDFKQALYYQKEWISVSELIAREANEKATRELAADYEFKLKQAEIKQEEERQAQEKKRQDNLQFLFIAIALIGAFVFIALLRRRISDQALNISTFVGFMFLFEFLIVLVEPSLLSLSGSRPIFILLGNTVIALLIAPLHHVTENFFKRAIARSK